MSLQLLVFKVNSYVIISQKDLPFLGTIEIPNLKGEQVKAADVVGEAHVLRAHLRFNDRVFFAFHLMLFLSYFYHFVGDFGYFYLPLCP